jgi:hypothetical protein
VLCARPSGEVVAALGANLSARYGPKPLICVRSLPSSAKSAARTSNSGPFGCRRMPRRGDGNGPTSRPRRMLSCFRTVSIRASQADAFSWYAS